MYGPSSGRLQLQALSFHGVQSTLSNQFPEIPSTKEVPRLYSLVMKALTKRDCSCDDLLCVPLSMSLCVFVCVSASAKGVSN